jgi:hypothetical protein
MGERPEDPIDCSVTYSALMKRCWAARPEIRPEVDEAVQILEAHQNEVRIEGGEIALTL